MSISTFKARLPQELLPDLLLLTNPYGVLSTSTPTSPENTPLNSPEKQKSIETLPKKPSNAKKNTLSYAQALTRIEIPFPPLSCNTTATLDAKHSSQNRAAISETTERQTKAYGCTTSEKVRRFTLKDMFITPKSHRKLFESSSKPLETQTKSYLEAFKGQSSSKRKIEEEQFPKLQKRKQIPMEIGSPLKKQKTPEKNKIERRFCPSLEKRITPPESTKAKIGKLNLTVKLPATFHQKPSKPVFSSPALQVEETPTPIEMVRKEILPPASYEDRPVNLGGSKKALMQLLDCSSFNITSVHSRISRIGSPGAKTTIISKYYSGAEHRIDAQRPPALIDGWKYQRLAYQSGSGQNVYAQVVVHDIAIKFLARSRYRERLLDFIKRGFLESFKNKKQYIISIRDKI